MEFDEFRNLFLGLSDQLSLTEKDIEFLMDESDMNQDGVIEYNEFIPLCVDLIESMYAKTSAQVAEAEADTAAGTRVRMEPKTVVKDITFRGIGFRDATDVSMEPWGVPSGGDWGKCVECA